MCTYSGCGVNTHRTAHFFFTPILYHYEVWRRYRPFIYHYLREGIVTQYCAIHHWLRFSCPSNQQLGISPMNKKRKKQHTQRLQLDNNTCEQPYYHVKNFGYGYKTLPLSSNEIQRSQSQLLRQNQNQT